MTALTGFIIESNRIENILVMPTIEEVEAHERFLALPHVELQDVERFVQIICKAALRRRVGMDVVVGAHEPPCGGPVVEIQLAMLLEDLNGAPGDVTPWQWHRAYETLHPFMDGNGRSGRILWAWHRRQIGHDPFMLPILQSIYYEALSELPREAWNALATKTVVPPDRRQAPATSDQ